MNRVALPLLVAITTAVTTTKTLATTTAATRITTTAPAISNIPTSCACTFKTIIDTPITEGCAITKAAPAGTACHCIVINGVPGSCDGYIVACKDQSSPHCINPGIGKLSCEQGQGNCGGYSLWPPLGIVITTDVTTTTPLTTTSVATTTTTTAAAATTTKATSVLSDFPCICAYEYNIGPPPTSGCVIVEPVPRHQACHCILAGLPPNLYCYGSNVACKDESSPHCINPGTGKPSCEQGQGNCGGYPSWPPLEISDLPNTCACTLKEVIDPSISITEGCAITQVAPRDKACHCILTRLPPIFCFGFVDACKNESSPHCINPGTGKPSCEQGQGNCGGYPSWPPLD